MPQHRYRAVFEEGGAIHLSSVLKPIQREFGRVRSATVTQTMVSGAFKTMRTLQIDVDGEGGGSVRVNECGREQLVKLTSRPRHFGGRQWFFVCPATGKLATVLWKPPGANSYASRKAWGKQVAYTSQFLSPPRRALSAACDLRFRLGGASYAYLDWPPPPKPKGMHRRTYERHLRRLERYEGFCNAYDAAVGGRLERAGLTMDFD